MFRADTVNTVSSARSSPSMDNTASQEIVLGVGTFGKVLIVRHTPTGETYVFLNTFVVVS
jgi:hypothetical protein